MKRFGSIGMICVLLLPPLAGCRLCCAPYDYCGPVYEGGQCSDLSKQRCGSVTAMGCIPEQVITGNPTVIQQAPAMKSTPAPAIQRTPTPKQPSSQVFNAVPQYRQQGRTSQVIQATAIQPVTNPSVGQGQIVVDANGYQKVEVYDENGKFLGHETIDASGKTIQPLDWSRIPQ